jgi:hypothetical protein
MGETSVISSVIEPKKVPCFMSCGPEGVTAKITNAFHIHVCSRSWTVICISKNDREVAWFIRDAFILRVVITKTAVYQMRTTWARIPAIITLVTPSNRNSPVVCRVWHVNGVPVNRAAVSDKGEVGMGVPLRHRTLDVGQFEVIIQSRDRSGGIGSIGVEP